MTAPNDYAHIFVPPLNTSFANQSFDDTNTVSAIKATKTINTRHLFYLLNKPENEQPITPCIYDFIRHHLCISSDYYASLVLPYSASSSSSLCDLSHHTTTLSQTFTQLKPLPIAPLSQQLATVANCHECIRQITAIQLTQPHWLRSVSQISCSQSKIATQIMTLYSRLQGGGQGDVTIEQSYQSLLLAIGINPPVLHTQDFSDKTDILDEVIQFATIQLALMRFPRLLFPEIMGFTLAFCQIPTLLEVCFPHSLLTTDFFKQRQRHIKPQITVIYRCISDYLALYPPQRNTLWLRIQYGFFLYQQQMQCCRDGLSVLMTRQPTLRQSMAKLLQQKAVAAVGHHQQIVIDGVSLDRWFAGMPENTQRFLRALKNSVYVDKHKPKESRLLQLFGAKGPMLGVLNDAELTLLQAWLTEDDDVNTASVSYHQTSAKSTNNRSVVNISATHTEQYKLLTNRELYYYLINADLFPDALPATRMRIKKWLNFCNFFCRQPFKRYSHAQFDDYIATVYHTEIKAYQPLQGQPKTSKAAYLWGIKQMAPMILIDGCWLQHSLAIKNINPEIAQILWHIYSDEIGNGVLAQNHPFIFQQLLHSLSITLPPIDSRQFAKHGGFINSAFDLPVYMLGLSCFTVQFLPELLGLNMAIELSGLGKNYNKLLDDWNYWQINTAIIKVHITADNYACGHTFLAKKAIKLYLDQIQQNSGDSVLVDKHWQRICCGYASLRLMVMRFKFALPISYLRVK